MQNYDWAEELIKKAERYEVTDPNKSLSYLEEAATFDPLYAEIYLKRGRILFKLVDD